MTTKQKKSEIKKLAKFQLKMAMNMMIDNIDKALNSGCIDIDEWDEKHHRMIIPNTIVVAILEDAAASTVLNGRGTSYEKKIKKEVKNIRYFI